MRSHSASSPPPTATDNQLRARTWAVTGIAALSLWILHDFLVPLGWAVILGLTTWPLYQRLNRRLAQGSHPALAALILTLLITLILFGPMTFGLVQLGHEIHAVSLIIQKAQRNGLPPPEWLLNLPLGEVASRAWSRWLGDTESVRASLQALLASDWLAYTRRFAALLLHRYVAVFFTVLMLFFVYREGESLGRKVLLLSRRAFGSQGSNYARHAARAVQATVNGIVFVALGQGIALGFGYAVAGLQHAVLLGVVTGLVAFVPFAAKLLFSLAALVLWGQGESAAAIGLMIYGLLVVLAADNYLRPKLIGDAVQLPFLWTLLGILGGIETFGLLGLFLGPTLMAILISVWRDSFPEPSPPLPPGQS